MSKRWTWFGLFSIWIVVTAYNLFKPFHIDDAAHLIISAWISQHPLHPMSGPLNWSGSVQPIYRTNQPHFYFYCLAVWERLFGFSEPALHALQSLFAGASILIFYKLARQLAQAHALWLTAMLALNPAFIVEQNLMVDIPLLSFWLVFFACLICGVESGRQNIRFSLAACACSAAILTKYSSLVLIPVLLIVLVFEGRLRQAWCLLIPAFVLLAWSVFNVFDYGGVHLMTGFHATATTYTPYKGPYHHFQFLHRLIGSTAVWKISRYGVSWVLGLGALTCFGIIFVAAKLPKAANFIYLVCLLGLLGLAVATASGVLPDERADKILALGFGMNGGLIFLTVLKPRRRPDYFYLQVWIFITTLFYVFASPFIAARHILLILPAISLLVAAECEISRRAKVFGLLMTSAIAAGLCVSDYRFAEFYRLQAETVRSSLPAGAKIWAAGHWGWQYYATQNGIAEIDVGDGLQDAISRCNSASVAQPGSIAFLEQDSLTRLSPSCADLSNQFPHESLLKAGDYLLVPVDVDYQLPTNIQIKFIRLDNFNASADDPFCTGRNDRFYLFSGSQGPWSLSENCDNSIEIFQVE